ncbi:hypothetical protein PQX77_012753 [Marasmius sp. AFHP31]|nr:hypothetical protein PQX77_012753 [Marasmius sp. AFHP31]
MGDVFLREETWSTNLEVVIQKPSTNPFRAGVETRVKVVKKHHTATIFPYGDQKFTVITLEPEDKKDEEATRFLWKAGYEALSTHRSMQFPKMVGLMNSDVPSFILYQELANGREIHQQYRGKTIVLDYLEYTRYTAIQAIRADTTLTVSTRVLDWSFDVNANTWHYDVALASLTPPEEYYSFTPLPRGTTPPRLDDDDIITYFEKTFGDALYLWVSSCRIGEGVLSDFARLGLFTFGAMAHYRRGILAHFPSTPTPEWAFENRSCGIKASYSAKVPSRVDFLSDERNRLRAAYLCQSYPFVDEWSPPNRSLSPRVFIDEISVYITGNFSPNLPPAYLFIPPLGTKVINGMHCIPYPLPNPLFYWAIDPAGINVIPEKECEQHGIPKLGVQIMLGSTWTFALYGQVQYHMHKKGYEPTDGKRYAQDHGYPELIYSDPHDQRAVELNDSGTDQPSCSKSESTSSLQSPIKSDPEDTLDSDPEGGIESNVGNGPECDSEHTTEWKQPPLPPKDEGPMTRWVKRLGFLKNAYISPPRDEGNLPGAASEEKAKEIDSDSWSLIDRED